MNKDVMISVKGIHFDTANGNENIEVFLPGQYYKKGDSHYLVYEELLDATKPKETCKNMIKFNNNSMTINKKGAVNASMIFDLNKKNLTNYTTPYGSIMIGLDTQSITLTENDSNINLKIKYSLDVNYEFLSDCNISITASNSADALL